jgi:hypothetical protein
MDLKIYRKSTICLAYGFLFFVVSISGPQYCRPLTHYLAYTTGLVGLLPPIYSLCNKAPNIKDFTLSSKVITVFYCILVG